MYQSDTPLYNAYHTVVIDMKIKLHLMMSLEKKLIGFKLVCVHLNKIDYIQWRGVHMRNDIFVPLCSCHVVVIHTVNCMHSILHFLSFDKKECWIIRNQRRKKCYACCDGMNTYVYSTYGVC